MYSLIDKQKEYFQISSTTTKYIDETHIVKKPQKMMERDLLWRGRGCIRTCQKRKILFSVWTHPKKKTLIVWRRLNLNNEKLFKKYIKEICKFLAYIKIKFIKWKEHNYKRKGWGKQIDWNKRGANRVGFLAWAEGDQ